jgi:signal transduction histidine kinase/CheY-like chemotaxis protein
MNRLRTLFTEDQNSKALLQSTSKYIIYSVSSFYLIFHFIVSLFFPRIFSPQLWISTIIFLVTLVATLLLLNKSYIIAQIIWLTGVSATILSAFFMFQRVEILFFFAVLPFMAISSIGVIGTFIVELVIIGITIIIPQSIWFPSLPQGYAFAISVVCIFTAVFGWGISYNLNSAIENASYHYYEARKRLQETRQHRAEISRMLKEQNQFNYQLKQMTRMLEQARAKAEEAREDRDRFAMAVSHELRSPLNFIIGFSDLMVNAPETYAPLEEWPPGVFDDAQEIFKSSKHLLDLINDILDMGKMDARQMPLFRERVEPKVLMDEIEDLVAAPIIQKGLDFEIQTEPDMPYIFIDRTRIRQVLLNVITNSMRFTKKGKIFVSAKMNGTDEVEILVQDDGPGISSEDMEKIFYEFRQAGQENWSREKGSGLGLPISKRFVELHGGRMMVESELQRGTIIRIFLPVMEPLPSIQDIRSDLAEGGEERVASLYAKRQAELILCFSADMSKARQIGMLLFDYEVVPVNNLLELKQMVENYYPSGIIIDDAFTSDLQISKLIESIPFQIPLVRFLFSEVLEQSLVLPGGVYRYLVKPVSRDVLIHTIQSLGQDTKNLLVIDDDPTMVRLFTQAIKSYNGLIPSIEGTIFLPAYSGKDALDIIAKQPVDAILLDLDLPDIHGTQVLSEIRKLDAHQKTPVIIISASDFGEEHKSTQPGYFQIMYKNPYNPSELRTIFQSILGVLKPDFHDGRENR